MKLVETEKLAPNQPGTVKITPEDADDLWLLYNLVSAGDLVAADTTRKIQINSGKNITSRVKINLQIRIFAVDFSKNSSEIQVRGKTTNETEHVSSGCFHTLDLETNKPFDLTKRIWDPDSILAVRDGANKSSAPDLAILLMQDGLANLFLIGKEKTKLASKIEGSRKFFEKVAIEFRKHVDFSVIRCAIIASPGSMKDEFKSHLLSLKLKQIEDKKSKIILVNTTSGNEKSLKEVISDSNIINAIKDTSTGIEIRVFKEFQSALLKDEGRACYGPTNVDVASELMAIETLLITDELYKNEEIHVRKKYVELVKMVKKWGGKALVFSRLTSMGEELATLTGVAAILRFPLHNPDDMRL
ncbi:eRF1 domain 3 [Dillenia turbinata]|uniref:Protein pelota homolog n=1 Tax=Dillenia turbinata TaxID=194707 RepID=A0AAN8WCB6_9MAGN